MRRKRHERKNVGLFEVPDSPHADDSADREDIAGVLGGPTHNSRLLGGPGHGSGLFDAPDRAPGELPGLFERPRRIGRGRAGRSEKPARAAGGGLFDKPAPRRK
jgi:hypothetical protein